VPERSEGLPDPRGATLPAGVDERGGREQSGAAGADRGERGGVELMRDPSTLRPHPEAGRLPSLSKADHRAFVADIRERGLTTPLVINPAGIVLDGHQRLRAALELGLERVLVRIVAPEDELSYILKEGLRRRNLTPAQKAALALELADYEELRARAMERRQANLPGRSEGATLPFRGRTRDYIAELAGCSGRTAQDVITVREEDAELFEQVKAGTKSAHQEAQEIRRERRLQKLGQAPPLPQGPFPLLYADPPWQSDNPDSPWAPENHYPTLALPEIKALAIPAADEAILFLWAVNCQLTQALEVMQAWGFTYKTNVVWVKPSPGIGRRIRNQHELLLLGQRGSFPAPEGSRVPASVVAAERGAHSEKPERFYELIEEMYPNCAKLELFARGKARSGWETWGNEVES
jgi:N6-adenosine-specific RNA methylase IME4